MYSFPDLEPIFCSMFCSNCCFLTYTQIFQETGKVIWYSHLFKNFPQFFVIHTVKGFGIVNEADVFLEFSWFFDFPTDVGNLISGSSAFSKTSLSIWKLTVHKLLWRRISINLIYSVDVVVVQSLNPVPLFVTSWTVAQRLLCPPLSPRICSDSWPLSWWCYLTSDTLLTTSPFAFNITQHESLIQWVDSSHQVAKVLKLQCRHQPFQWILKVDFF